jgi:hypothetical protein
MTQQLRVGLDSWIIQDGNYDDFVQGQHYAFALEFWAPNPLVVGHPDMGEPHHAMTWLRDSTYAVMGRVGFVSEGWWVLDVGIPIYSDQIAAPGPVGTTLCGEIYLGVDHFSYFERLARESDAPALIFDWRIEAIELDTTPRVETKPRYVERDQSRQSWRSVQQTDAWSDDDGLASYVFTCKRLSDEPRLCP